jgi:hypothetical protein
LSLKCGVRTATVTLTTEEPTDFKNYYVRKVAGGWAMSRRIPEAMPLYYLKSHSADILSPMGSTEAVLNKKFLWALDKRCPVGKEAYSDFPDCPSTEVIEAAAWDSRARLLGHAFRALLYCSYGHISNCLVDTSARLWLIDHEKMVYRKDAGDIEALHAIVSESESVMGICRELCTITADDVTDSLAGIPDVFWRGAARFTDLQTSAAYFTGRLSAWREHYGKPERMVKHAGE